MCFFVEKTISNNYKKHRSDLMIMIRKTMLIICGLDVKRMFMIHSFTFFTCLSRGIHKKCV